MYNSVLVLRLDEMANFCTIGLGFTHCNKQDIRKSCYENHPLTNCVLI